ncbi:MAG TPA: hypothetical protein VGI76_11695 [Solirubrobacteraceae bacterium]|jgi:hypothetical protein
MTTMTNPGVLSEQIERLVREYILATRVAAQAALDRAFAPGAVAHAKQVRPASPSRPGVLRESGVRRSPGAIGALGERIYEAVCRMPGETMTVLGPQVGASARELHRPMQLLKRAGRVRSVGTRHSTRYFPMARASD